MHTLGLFNILEQRYKQRVLVDFSNLEETNTTINT